MVDAVGDFRMSADYSQALKGLAQESVYYAEFSNVQKEVLDAIFTNIGEDSSTPARAQVDESVTAAKQSAIHESWGPTQPSPHLHSPRRSQDKPQGPQNIVIASNYGRPL